MTLPFSPTARRPSWRRSRARPPVAAVEVLICGSADRGDDGAPIAASRRLRDRLEDDVRMRVVGQLDIDDLLGVPAGAGVVIVDAATGLRRGQIVELPLNGLSPARTACGRARRIRSSSAR